MRTLIVYYSLEGNTDYAAGKIAERIGADKLRLVPKDAYKDKGFAKFFYGGKSAIMKEVPALETYNIDLSEYDRVIFGFPVWAGNFTPPLRTFILDQKDALKGKRFSAFACQEARHSPNLPVSSGSSPLMKQLFLLIQRLSTALRQKRRSLHSADDWERKGCSCEEQELLTKTAITQMKKDVI